VRFPRRWFRPKVHIRRRRRIGPLEGLWVLFRGKSGRGDTTEAEGADGGHARHKTRPGAAEGGDCLEGG
jgi:hypothetical protein